MKNLFVSAGVVSAMFLSSCGGALSPCDCITTTVEMMKEASEAGQDEAKIKEIEEKYKSEIEACEKMGENMEKEMEGLSDEEREAKGKEMEKELEDCPAMKEMQGLMGEMMMNGMGDEIGEGEATE